MKSKHLLPLMVVFGLLVGLTTTPVQASAPQLPEPVSHIYGPFTSEPIYPEVFNGDLRSLPQIPADSGEPGELPLRLTPSEQAAMQSPTTLSEQRATPTASSAPMPPPIIDFAGLDFANFGSGWPPDINGDVGPNYYVQTVNTSVGIYYKPTGLRLTGLTFDNFFTGPSGTPCDNNNNGDPVALYDPLADRWIVTDFAWSNATGPFYQCIAVSRNSDPLFGGWYFYALRADTGIFEGYLNDYPKLGVWPDAYYMSANMFQQTAGDGFGVRLWALDRAAMLAGDPLNEVHFDLCTDGSCGSFLPSNLRGTPPPAGSPNYFMQAGAPDQLNLYRFHVDWATPGNSSLNGPISIPISPFTIFQDDIPQRGTTQGVDSLSFRLMMQLQYRNYGAHEALFANHTINEGGIASARWYEIRDPGGAPTLFQEGTHILPDGNHRWMGSIAADREGNVALGYSVSGQNLYPAIRYAGRRSGEFPGQLPQTETSLIEGLGSQIGISRWGDYSAMTVDPTDDCTFWYTNEYYLASGNNWQTRIGSFRFPACGEAKGTLNGRVYNAATGAGIPGAPVTLAGSTETLTVATDANGDYEAQVLPGAYTITAGPLLPGYPTPNSMPDRTVAADSTTTTDIPLNPAPHLIRGSLGVDDSGLEGNGNGNPEPGENDIELFVGLTNDGAATSTGVSAVLSALTPGVVVSSAASTYPDISAGEESDNNTAYVISIAPTTPCGVMLDFRLNVTTDQENYALDFSIMASVPQPPTAIFNDDFEMGANGWTTGGTTNSWAQTISQAHSPTHSWTDSPDGDYVNNVNSWLQSPLLDLSDKTGVTVSAWYRHELEAGFDFTYLEYSTDGGSTWNATPLADYNSIVTDWYEQTIDAPMLDNQANVGLRYRFFSDAGVVDDGFYVDDFVVSYTPIVCVAPCPFDFNGNDRVDIVDVQGAAAAFNTANSAYDFDGDGLVDIDDIQRIAGRWNTPCSNP